MRKTILFVVFVIGMVATTFGQTVIIKVNIKGYASTGAGNVKVGIHIMQDGKYEYIEGFKAKKFEENMRAEQRVLDRFFNDGYDIVKMASAGAGGNSVSVIQTTYILRKE